MDELGYWLELMHTPGIGVQRYQQILTHIQHPRELFDGSRPDLLEELPFRAKQYLRNPDWHLTERSLEWASHPGNTILTLDNPFYPARLKAIADPPPLLFVKGNPELLNEPQLGIVGSRNPSPQGKQNGYSFSSAISHVGMTITSGLALGIDTVAHAGALLGPGKTVAVIGTGIDIDYPRSNRGLAEQIAEQGVIVSEFPLGTAPTAGNFPRRNRIISGLSLGVLVVEASVASGSLITARLAAEQGREVFAIPGSIHNPMSRGCHQLIREGVKLVEVVDDILSELAPQLVDYFSQQVDDFNDKPQISTSPEHEQLLKNIGYDPISVEELIARCRLTAEEISSMLIQLELNSLIASSAGRYYRLPEKAIK